MVALEKENKSKSKNNGGSMDFKRSFDVFIRVFYC